MPYIQIVLKELPITSDREHELTAGAIEVITGLERKGDSGSITVSIEEGCKNARLPREVQPGTVAVRIHVCPQSTSAQDRARIIWARIDMLRGVLKNNDDTAYQVIIDEVGMATEFPFTEHNL